ncbi:MAG TPA: PAS domain-containing protein [Gemmatimonadales bacterium]|nr:PAS domain-containing protein [Gemmatimonadales bacterium]
MTDLQAEVRRLRARVAELERAAGLFDRLPVALTLYDHELRYVRVNEAFAALYDRAPEEFVGRTIWEMAPEVAPRLVPHYRRVLATGLPAPDLEVRGEFPPGSGTLRDLIVGFYPIADAAGAPRGVGAAVTDVTALKRAEARFSDLLDANVIGVGLRDAGGRIVQVNDALLDLLGYTRADFEAGAVPWAELTPPEYYASDEKAVAQTLAAGRCTPYEKEYLRRDGSRVPVLVGGGALGERRDTGVFFVVDLSDRRRAEAALAASEARLRAAVAAAQMGTWRWDIDAGVASYDAGLNALFGRPAEPSTDPAGKFLERLHPDDRPVVAARLRAALEQGADFDVDYRVALGEGRVRWLRDVGRLVRDEDGRPLYMTGACMDITAHKAAEAERARLLDASSFLAEASRVLASSLDYETTLASVADLAVPRIADWCTIDIVDEGGTPRRLVVSHPDPAKVELAWELARRFPEDPATAGGPYAVIRSGRAELVSVITPELIRAMPHDPAYVRMVRELGLVSYMAVPLEARGRVLGAITFIAAESGRHFGAEDLALAEDLARRAALAVDNARLYREAQAAVRQQSVTLAMLDATLHSAPVGLCYLDRDLRYVRINQVLADANGLPVAAHLGRTVREVLPALAEQIEPLLRRVFETGEPVLDREVVDTERRGTPGRPEYWVVSFYPVTGPDGPVQWVGAVAVDMTDRRQAEEALRQAQKLESIGVLAGGIAHDFNNLLTGIMGNASLALRSLPPETLTRTAPLLEDVVRASERAADLTQQLLAYAGKGRFFVKPVELPALVREIGSLVRTSVPKKVALQLQLEACPPIEADASQLQQIVMNLILNAAEAIEDAPGVVTVTTGPVRLDAATARARFRGFDLAPGDYAQLEVRDTGCGMDAETLARIFDPFFTTKFTGRGLGLAAALGIVRGHHGAIAVESAPGRGTTFTVAFPAIASAPPPAPTAPGGGAARAGGEGADARGVILVADDEEVVRRIARAVLEEQGFTVEVAGTGLEALERIRRAPRRFRLVLLDMVMPVMGGEEAIGQLQALTPDLPVIVTSGYGELEALRRFEGARIAGFLPKPFTARQLADAIRAALAAPAG